MQLHLGPLRNNRTRLFQDFGPDAGCDSMGDWGLALPLNRFLDTLDQAGKLPRMIFYNIHPMHSELLASTLGNFQDGTIPCKLQLGCAWWYLDQLDGILRNLETISNLSLLSRFVGMLTDSRSLLSYSRHEYFRRILCNLLGEDVRRGRLPNDQALLGNLVRDVSYRNAERYFKLPGASR